MFPSPNIKGSDILHVTALGLFRAEVLPQSPASGTCVLTVWGRQPSRRLGRRHFPLAVRYFVVANPISYKYCLPQANLTSDYCCRAYLTPTLLIRALGLVHCRSSRFYRRMYSLLVYTTSMKHNICIVKYNMLQHLPIVALPPILPTPPSAFQVQPCQTPIDSSKYHILVHHTNHDSHFIKVSFHKRKS